MKTLLEELKEKRDALDERIKEMETRSSVFTPNKGDDFWIVRQSAGTGVFEAFIHSKSNDAVINVFRTQEAAKDFAFGIGVMMELRACEGARKFVVGEDNWCIVYDADEDALFPHLTEFYQTGCVFSCFDSEEAAFTAIKTVGRDKVIKAIKALA